MTNQNHPITPSKELEHKWASMFEHHSDMEVFSEIAQWGADQELEACCQKLPGCANFLRATRRPKPPSLKEQALAVLDDCSDRLEGAHENTIRRALEALPNE